MARPIRVAGVAGLTVLATLAAACGGSSGGSGGGGAPQPHAPAGAYIHQATNAGGTPQYGGVLNVLGTGDVDYMDPNITYYTLGYSVARLVSRNLYSYSGKLNHTTEAVPDLATGLPKITNGGKTYTITMRSDAFWNTTPKRVVSGADFVRGVEISCNPSQPFGGQGDYNFLIVGYKTFCAGFGKVKPNPAAIKSYLSSHSISGVKANGQTVTINLTQPASFFTDMLTLSPFTPRPVEELAYLPASAQLAQHLVSDGPYTIKSYNPGKLIDFVKNPAWTAASDPIRKGYVNEIKLVETDTPESIEQQVSTNSPSADMTFATEPPVAQLPGLIRARDPNLNCEPGISNTYFVFNTQDPNDNGALKNVKVRQALEYGINRARLLQIAGGPQLNPPLTHVLPSEIVGSKDFNLYPYNPAKAKSLLQQAGVKHVTLKYLYRQSSTSAPKILQSLQNDLKPLGITVKPLVVPDADIYVKYLEVPDTAKRGVWDIAGAGWIPDWYGQAALSFFSPLFDGRTLPPASSNFGLYNDPKTNALIDQGLKATTVGAANAAWQAADRQVMADAPIFPESDSVLCLRHGTQAHNDVYIPSIETFDFANVWLDKTANGG